MMIVAIGEKNNARYFILKSEGGMVQESEELQRLAYHVFQERLNEEWYIEDEMPAVMRRYYLKAKAGDHKSALTLLVSRKDYEYESFTLIEPEHWENV